MISSVEKAEVDEADPEETYADTAALLRRRDGLSALLAACRSSPGHETLTGSVAASTRTSAEILSSTPDTHSLAQLTVGTAETCASLMRPLTAAAEVSLNRRALLDAGALPALLAEARPNLLRRGRRREGTRERTFTPGGATPSRGSRRQGGEGPSAISRRALPVALAILRGSRSEDDGGGGRRD